MSSNGPTLLAAPDPATTKWVPLMGLGGAPQNVTKFIDVAPTGASQAGFASNLTWSDGVDTSAYFFFEVPADYVSGSIVFRVKLAGAATGAVAWRFSRFRLRAGTAQVAVESNTNDDFTPGTTNIQVRNVVWPAGDFQAGDMLRVDLRRLGADAADTMAASVSYGGAWIEYTGSSWASASGSGSADLEYNGEYPAATPYTDGDIVIYQGQAYLCVRPTSAAPTPWVGAALPPVAKLFDILVPAGGQASIDFPNIPQTYRSLMIDVIGRVGLAVTASNLGLRCNGDAGANYYSEVLPVSGSAAAAGGEALAATSGRSGTLPGTSAPAGKPGFVHIVIPDYAGTTFHKIWNVNGGEVRGITTGLVYVRTETGHWANAAAITSLSLIDTSGGSFVAGSRATLYGFA